MPYQHFGESFHKPRIVRNRRPCGSHIHKIGTRIIRFRLRYSFLEHTFHAHDKKIRVRKHIANSELMTKRFSHFAGLESGDNASWEREFRQRIQSFNEASATTTEFLADDILNLGQMILKKGTPLQQELVLDLGRQRGFIESLTNLGIVNRWFDLEWALIQALNFTPGKLIQLRQRQFPQKALLRFHNNYQWQEYNWSDVLEMSQRFAAGILRITQNNPGPIAIISENRVEVALADIACLSYGFLNVPIQSGLPSQQLAYILKHAGIDVVVISNSGIFERLQSALGPDSSVRHVVTFDEITYRGPFKPIKWSELQKPLSEEARRVLDDRQAAIKLDAPATFMYTSGTTGNPKAIIFTYGNIIAKRFARALVFKVDEKDSFLAYLPLYHTFGRYLELWGCVFWGATYNFASGTTSQSLMADLQVIRPTVLISVPRRWQEIYERITSQFDPIHTSRLEIRNRLQELLGGRLRLGLSAAGYLDPEIFQFFQSHDIHLLSGYGMTEATGGVTMTPPSDYVVNSVGVPLPGIELKLGEDGELLMRGPYVSKSYYQPEFEDLRIDEWFGTGDIFRELPGNHLEIIDRKKEIYKNAKGQTIAPQKIENLFRDFDAVHQIYLVGDHRPFNTALIYPNHDAQQVREHLTDTDHLNAYFTSLVNSVNSFLAPYERIVNFTLIDRAFSANLGEVTPKGTYKRHVIHENFKRDIDRMYEKPYQSLFLDDFEVRIPTWFLLERGWTREDLEAKSGEIINESEELRLVISRSEPGQIRIGDLQYQYEGMTLDLDLFIRQPAYWIGNDSLLIFLGYETLPTRNFNPMPQHYPGSWTPIRFSDQETAEMADAISSHLSKNKFDFFKLHDALCLLLSDRNGHSNIAFQYLVRAARQAPPNLQSTIYYAFVRLVKSTQKDLIQAAFQQALGVCNGLELNKLLDYALSDAVIFNLDPDGLEEWPNINSQKLKGLLARAEKERVKLVPGEVTELSIFNDNLITLLTAIGIVYPQYHVGIRSEIVHWQITLKSDPGRVALLQDFHRILVDSFRHRLGLPASMATTPDSEQSYGWLEVIQFDDDVSDDHRARILDAMSNTPLLNEALFTFYHGRSLRLQDIPVEGIAVELLGSAHRKAVYKVDIQTRELDTFYFAINVNIDLPREILESEVRWLQASVTYQQEDKIVEEFGGYYPDQELWTEEFIPGKSVEQHLYLLKEGRTDINTPPAAFLWPHFVWTGIGAYFSFWRQTQFEVFVADPNPANIIIPPHDYYRGGRIISIASRVRNQTPYQTLHLILEKYIHETARTFLDINAYLTPTMVYSPIYEALEPEHGRHFLEMAIADSQCPAELREEVQNFLDEVETQGFCPKPVFFAILRYQRWLKINPDATLRAKGRYIQELLKDYNITDCTKLYPDARLRLFLDTVFAEASLVVRAHLRSWMSQQRELSLPDTRHQWEIRELLSNHELSDEEAYFLKRLPLPHLSGADSIEIIANPQTGFQDVEIMVTRRDFKGDNFHIRRPINPKEILRLHRLFGEFQLDVQFKSEHEYLLALNENGHVIAGLFYEPVDTTNIFMDKIVVASSYSGRGISRALMDEFFNRIRGRGYDVVTTGFYQPGYFYKQGFRVEKNYEGLVKQLN